MRLCTTEAPPGRRVQSWIGLETVVVTFALSFARDALAAIRDWWGGRSATVERGIRQAQRQAFAELRAAAEKRGADAVVGLRSDMTAHGARVSMLSIRLTGTLVRTAAETER